MKRRTGYIKNATVVFDILKTKCITTSHINCINDYSDGGKCFLNIIGAVFITVLPAVRSASSSVL